MVHEATGAPILGHPLRALEVLSARVESRGESLPAGSLVLADALTDAVPMMGARSYELTVEGLGTVALRTYLSRDQLELDVVRVAEDDHRVLDPEVVQPPHPMLELSTRLHA